MIALALVFLYWFFAGPALLLAAVSLRGERKRADYVAQRLAERPEDLPPATVIVPVKGYDEGLRENLAALAALDYPDYELIVTAQSAGDIPAGVLPARVRVVLSHGADSGASEKIQNLMAAVRAARKRTQVLAFADSDGRVTAGWLRALVAPLAEPGVGASTGYRWFLPDPPDFWSLLRGVWDAVAVGMLGAGDNRFAWGGAMAIRKELFFEARVPEFWQGALSDDLTLSEAVHAAGLTIAYAPGALTAVRGAHHGQQFLPLDSPADGDHCGSTPRGSGGRPDRAHLLLRRHGGIAHRVDRRKSSGGVGADRAAFARYVEGPESRDARQGCAARVRGLVQTALLGARHLGPAGHVGVADRAAVLGIRPQHRMARAAVLAEARLNRL